MFSATTNLTVFALSRLPLIVFMSRSDVRPVVTASSEATVSKSLLRITSYQWEYQPVWHMTILKIMLPTICGITPSSDGLRV
ncbi:hypothetical protein SERLADRAFT_457025 [Serpula lacrymans var. lacrymans S7.9]|uniref:Uncharacterized protein n=1 Tax=Serpula lacrymans var. lacrymans (strain S7.9) TaxID=578457 RepID=F8NGJ5_SERL9|nr:uncharacterized protein SERLADRAFT_457025 [Serpula lacrymans var. lacrymans S7.9]EGO29382.1 hypothetical protein SERLADRAFT_457025 [Serpula lacrymans var. lacrymans S7.9]